MKRLFLAILPGLLVVAATAPALAAIKGQSLATVPVYLDPNTPVTVRSPDLQELDPRSARQPSLYKR